jgi:hypothetical protein
VSDPDQLRALGKGLAALRVELSAEQAARAIEPFLKSIAATSDPYQLRALGQGLAALADRVQSPDQAGRGLVEALRNPFTDPQTTEILIQALQKHFASEISEQAGLWEVFAWSARRPRN